MNDTRKSLPELKAEREKALARDRQQLLSLPPEKALDLLADHPYPVTLVQSMAEEDFYYLVHAVGPEDAKPVLAVASNRQWEYLVDMETWDRDTQSHHAMTLWLERLLKADPDRFTHWIAGDKKEDFIRYLFKNIDLHIREYEEDPAEVGEEFFSEDQTHYIRLLPYPAEQKKAQEHRDQFLTDLLRRMSTFDFVAYRNMLISSSVIIPAEAEEEGFRLRNARLAEKGFLPFDEAIGVYQPLTVDELFQRQEKVFAADDRPVAAFPLPVDMDAPDEDASRFVKTLLQFTNAPALQLLQSELAALCNQVIAAEQKQIREKQILNRVVQKVGDYISIGLEKVAAASDAPVPYGDAVLLQKYLLADIFRVGYGSALAVKWRADRWQRDSWFTRNGLPLSFWGEKGMGVLGGLLIKKPLYFDNYDQGVLYREFSRLADIDQTEGVLDRIVAFDDLLSLLDIEPEVAVPDSLVTYRNLILTAWANHHLAMETPGNRPVALTASQLRLLLSEMWDSEAPPRRIRRSMREIFLGWLADRSGLADYEIAERMAAALEQMFADVEDELGQVPASEIDPRYIQSFIMRPST